MMTCNDVLKTARMLFILVSIAFGSSSRARADYNLDLTPFVSGNLKNYTNGANYPNGGNTVTLNGVNFQLSNFPATGTINPNATGILQVGPNRPSIDVSNIGIDNVVDVYTFINSSDGLLGKTIGTVTFKGTGVADYVVSLVEGQNVRDHYQGTFQNSINTSNSNYFGTVNYAGGVRFDAQHWILPTRFSTSTLTDIVLSYNTANTDVTWGAPFLAAVTLRSVPEPASIILVGTGFVVVLALGRGRYRV